MVGPGLAVDLGESIARLANVRFGSKADICSAQPMSALPPKADMCSAQVDVRFVPIADMLPFVFHWRFSGGASYKHLCYCVGLSDLSIR